MNVPRNKTFVYTRDTSVLALLTISLSTVANQQW